MCDPISISLLVGGLAANEYGNRQAAKAQKRVLSNGMGEQRQMQGEINKEVVSNAAKNFDPTQYAAHYEDAAAAREKALGQTLNEINSAPAGQGAGQLSADYLQAKASQTADQADAISKLARLMGRASAGTTVSQGNSIRTMESNDHLTGIGQRMKDSLALMQTRLGEAAHAGDTAKTVGQLMQLGGMVYAPGIGAAGAATPAQQIGVGRGILGTGATTNASGAYTNAMFGALA